MLHFRGEGIAERLLRMNGAICNATLGQWSAIKGLIERAELPLDDLNESMYSFFYVYSEGSQVQGVIALEPLANRYAMLRSLVVEPSARGKGVGHALVDNLEAHARSQQVAEIFLLTTSAGRFFSQLGYEGLTREAVPDGVKGHAQFRTLCPASAFLMSRRIRP